MSCTKLGFDFFNLTTASYLWTILFSLGLDDGKNFYSCGISNAVSDSQYNYEWKNGRLCSRFKLETQPQSHSLSFKLINLTKGAGLGDEFTYCRCKGHLCNGYPQTSTNRIKCYSTPKVDEINEPVVNLGSQTNIVTCPPGITQCYQKGINHR